MSNNPKPTQYSEQPAVPPRTVRVHFYGVDWLCWVSVGAKLLGMAAMYDMTYIHVAVETPTMYAHLTMEGFEVIDDKDYLHFDQTVYVDVEVDDLIGVYDRLDAYVGKTATLHSVLRFGHGDNCVSTVLDALGLPRYTCRTATQLWQLLSTVYNGGS